MFIMEVASKLTFLGMFVKLKKGVINLKKAGEGKSVFLKCWLHSALNVLIAKHSLLFT